jgi:hypothetical protein
VFRVEWVPDALNDLASVWIGADSAQRRAINVATNAIDERLRSDPFGSSESRANDDRVLFEEPLGVLFVVNLTKRSVRVEHVWQYRQRTR